MPMAKHRIDRLYITDCKRQPQPVGSAWLIDNENDVWNWDIGTTAPMWKLVAVDVVGGGGAVTA